MSRRAAALCAALPLVAALAFIAAPLPQGMLGYAGAASVRILDRTGQPLREVRSDEGGRLRPLSKDALPPRVVSAFLAAEDARFYSHAGVDPLAIARAAWSNVRAGRVVSGGSTITQQLARTLVPRPRTLLGKLQEALWAVRLEAHLSKEALLAQYLNRIPFGNGAFGIEAASQLYFGRSAEHLSLAQAAALAAIPRGPTAYNPYRQPERLAQRQAWILERMVATGRATEDDARSAAREPLDLRPPDAAFRAPHFAQHVLEGLHGWGLQDAVELRTSIDPELQAYAEAVVAEEVSRLSGKNVGQAAALVIDNETGEVLAYVGSADFADEERWGQNDGVQMRRQPGSVLKPFAYLEAFRAGFTPASVLADTQAHFPSVRGTYAPKNYDRRHHGPVRAREALANSYNVPAVRLVEQVGAERILEGLRAAGFTLHHGTEHYGLGVVLGNGEVSLWETARAYSALARGGELSALRPIIDARRADGSAVHLSAPAPHRFAEEAHAAQVTDILSDNAARARAFGLDNVLRLPFPAAAKTGTSKGYSDNWTVGFTRERTVAVWAGNFDGAPMTGVSGITGAGPIFQALMVRAMRGRTPAPLFDASLLERAYICPLSGQRASDACPAQMQEVFVPGTAPDAPCAMHKAVDALAGECRALAAAGRFTDLGPEYDAWARAEGLSTIGPKCRPRAEGAARISFPARNARFKLIAGLPRADQAIPLRVEAPAEAGPLEVRIDGVTVFELAPPFVGRIEPREGKHTLSVHRPGSAQALAKVTFTVDGTL